MIKQKVSHITIQRFVCTYCCILPLVKTDKLSQLLSKPNPFYSSHLLLFNSSFTWIIIFPSLIYHYHQATIILKFLYLNIIQSPITYISFQLKLHQNRTRKGVVYASYLQFLTSKFLLCLILKFYSKHFTKIGLDKVINDLFLVLLECQF